jgi:hypothetical protein
MIKDYPNKAREQEGMEDDHKGVEVLETVVIKDRIGFMGS